MKLHYLRHVGVIAVVLSAFLFTSCSKENKDADKNQTQSNTAQNDKQPEQKSIPTDQGQPQLFEYDDGMSSEQNQSLQTMMSLPEIQRNSLASMTKTGDRSVRFTVDEKVVSLVAKGLPSDISTSGPKFVNDKSTLLAPGWYLMAGMGSANGRHDYDTLKNANDWFNGKRYELFHLWVLSKSGSQWVGNFPSALQCNIAAVEIGDGGRIKRQNGVYAIRWVKLEKFAEGPGKNLFKWAFHLKKRWAFDFPMCEDRIFLSSMQESVVSQIKAMSPELQKGLIELTPSSKTLTVKGIITDMIRGGMKAGANNHLVFLCAGNGWALGNDRSFDQALKDYELHRNGYDWSLTMPTMQFGNLALVTTDNSGKIIDVNYLMPEFITDSSEKMLPFFHNHYLNEKGSVGIWFPEFGPRP